MKVDEITLDNQAATDLLAAIHSREPVSGLTHNFYRYPARFSPVFARAVIKAFTMPGDMVLDPFMGGGTTLVEARTLGRMAVGVDLSSLAAFITQVKTTPLSEADLADIDKWVADIDGHLNIRNSPARAQEWIKEGYQRNISDKKTWRIRKILELALASVNDLNTDEQQRFVRCALLKTGQWALDCRRVIPSVAEFRCKFRKFLKEMSEGAREFTSLVQDTDSHWMPQGLRRTICLNRSAIGLNTDPMLTEYPRPRLILTSPPYPGVHAVYHRWQVQGRKETPAPFWITSTLDSKGASFYTLGDRRRAGLVSYFRQAQEAFSSIACLADHNTIVVQLVAFSDPSWQLSEYLGMMQEAGFVEVKASAIANSDDGRVWRCVPNRKWYANQRGAITASKEVVLFHRTA